MAEYLGKKPDSLLMSLEESVIFQMSCFKCKETMAKPIYHCEMGHSSCSKCHEIGKLCDFCGSKNTGIRTYHLERILDQVAVCQTKFPNEDGDKLYRCPMEIENCTFLGSKRQIVFHCQLFHGQFFFVNGKSRSFKQKLVLPKKLDPLHRSFYLYYTDDNLFKAQLNIFNSSKIQIQINHLSLKTEKVDPYDYILKFYNSQKICLLEKKCCVNNSLNEKSSVEISAHDLDKWPFFSIEFVKRGEILH